MAAGGEQVVNWEAAVLGLYGLESLDAATKENWPWWEESDRYIEPGGGEVFILGGPYLPDFSADKAAAVKLAKKMASRSRLDIRMELGEQSGDLMCCTYWEATGRTVVGDDLGECLTATLAARAEEPT